jgi:glycosyltransferase involved in cell wall biosynthesis
LAKIVFLGNFGVDYSSESHHAKSLESLGHSVTRLQETEIKAENILVHALKSDLFIWIHTHGWKTPGLLSMEKVLDRLKENNIPSITYHLDLWFGLQRQKDLEIMPVYKKIEHFFTVDSKMAQWFNEETNVKGHYLPAGVFGEECTYKESTKKRDVIFVGSKKYHPEWQYRTQLVNWLDKVYGNRFEHYGNGGVESVRGLRLNKLYWSTKVVVGDTLCLNFNYPDYWSDRIYETLGRGGFLIHPYIPGIEKEFVDKKHVVFYEYGNFEQLKELIDYYLTHEEEREEIRKAGHELVKGNYTYRHRWQHIIKELGL